MHPQIQTPFRLDIYNYRAELSNLVVFDKLTWEISDIITALISEQVNPEERTPIRAKVEATPKRIQTFINLLPDGIILTGKLEPDRFFDVMVSVPKDESTAMYRRFVLVPKRIGCELRVLKDLCPAAEPVQAV